MSSSSPSSVVSGTCRRVAVVTGAATRIGAVTAGQLHTSGYNVLLHYNNSSKEAEEIAARLNALRPNSVVTCQASFSGFGGPDCSAAHTYRNEGDGESLQAACRRVFQTAVDSFGDVHVLVNSASSYLPVPLVDLDAVDNDASTDRKLDTLLSSNVIAPWYLTRAFATYVVRRERQQQQQQQQRTQEDPATLSSSDAVAAVAAADRCIVNIGDSLLSRPHANHSAYCMAKAALENLVVTSSIELAEYGIRVNCVRPGYNVFPERMPETNRAQHRHHVPLGKKEGTPSDIASAVLYLANEATYCTGTFIDVDGGLRHKPIL